MAMMLTGHKDALDAPGCIDEQREAAGFLHEAFAEAILAGIDTRAFAEASIAIGLEELVSRYGDEAVVLFSARLAERVRGGEFSDAARH